MTITIISSGIHVLVHIFIKELHNVMGKPTGPNNGFLCFTYAIMTIVATTMSMAIVVAVGLTGAGNVLATMPDGYCDKFSIAKHHCSNHCLVLQQHF